MYQTRISGGTNYPESLHKSYCFTPTSNGTQIRKQIQSLYVRGFYSTSLSTKFKIQFVAKKKKKYQVIDKNMFKRPGCKNKIS
jgi:hypothetical protein